MITLATDASNDLVLDRYGNVSMITGIEATEQTAAHFALTARGEMAFAIDDGVPFWDVAFGAAPMIAQFEAAVRQRILQTPSVLGVSELTARQNEDVLGYTATIVTEFGTGVINYGV